MLYPCKVFIIGLGPRQTAQSDSGSLLLTLLLSLCMTVSFSAHTANALPHVPLTGPGSPAAVGKDSLAPADSSSPPATTHVFLHLCPRASLVPSARVQWCRASRKCQGLNSAFFLLSKSPHSLTYAP